MNGRGGSSEYVTPAGQNGNPSQVSGTPRGMGVWSFGEHSGTEKDLGLELCFRLEFEGSRK